MGLEVTPLAQTVLYPPQGPPEAIPRYISGRTSYHQARLAFHSYPQVIRGFFTTHRFGPPAGVTPPSPCPGVARLASGLPTPTERPIRTRFPYGSAPEGLSLADAGNSRAHVAKGTPPPRISGAMTACRQWVSGSISLPFPGCFSPFPHGT